MTLGIVIAALVAGALGAVVRWLVTLGVRGRGRIPLAVLIVNGVGCLAAGIALGAADRFGAGEFRYVLLSGFAGGLTTFSTFGVETIQLWLDGRRGAAAGNVLANLAVGIPAVLVGWGLILLLPA